MIRAFKYFAYILFLPVWIIQYFIPRNKNIWVFGAWYSMKYSDNSKSLYEYVSNNHKSIKAVWLTKSEKIYELLKAKQKTVYYTNSLKGIYYSLRAKFVIVSSGKRDVNLFFINGAKKVQLWHGNSLKKVSLDDKFSSVNSFFYSKIVKNIFPMIYEYNFDYTTTNAPVFTPLISSAFNIPVKNILDTGNPRNDTFFKKQQTEFIKALRIKFADSKIVFYLPTFRNHIKPNTIFNSEKFNAEAFELFLEKEKLVFINKGHFVDKKINDVEGNRLINLSDEEVIDINLLLKDADCLVTDYSCVYFDFLLTQKPIIFAAYDLEDYIAYSRELYFNYEDIVAGPIAKNWQDLLNALSALNQSNKYKSILKEKNGIYNKYHDDNNSKRVFEKLKQL